MTPSDPRHGTRPGALQHYKDGEKPCGPCAAETYRVEKAAKLRRSRGEVNLVPLGADAWKFISDPLASRPQVSAATGLSKAHLARLSRRGPTAVVQRGTRDAILRAARTLHIVTPVGLQRRLQALSAIGWSMKVLADRYGMWTDALCCLRRRQHPKTVKKDFAQSVVRIYNDLSMQIPPAGPSADRTRLIATARGYLPPLAWDDDTIDDPKARPVGVTGSRRPRKTEIDDVVVQHFIEHTECRDLTKAEREEAARRLRASGVSDRRIEHEYGIKAVRYLPAQREAVAA